MEKFFKRANSLICRPVACLLWIFLGMAFALRCSGATFTNNASIQISDSNNGLTSTGSAFTASCWFRIAVPSSLQINDNMTILMDRLDGDESQKFSYLIRYNYASNIVEFVTHGDSGTYSQTLIQGPFLNRWYHVAVSRSGSTFNTYVDGRALPAGSASIGTATGSGVSIGGINGSSKQFYGDIVEVAIYQTSLTLSVIQSGMFKDQRNFPNIKGYYKLGASTNQSDFYHNFAPTPPSGTDPAGPVGSGKITFNPVDEAGEQSLFDANLNHGENAATPLSGAFSWNQTAFSRPVPGIAFDFEFGYSSALPTLGQNLGQQDPYDVRVLSPKWRNTFDVRVALGATANEIDLVNWDGSIDAWTRTNTFAPLTTKHHEYHGEMQQLQPTAEIQWTTPTRLKYLFRDPTDTTDPMAGRLEQIQDLNGNTVSLQWDPNSYVVTNVVDTVGQNYQLFYNQSSQFLLTNITFGAWQINFGYDSSNRLASKTLTNTSGLYGAVNATWQFHYGTNGLLSQIVDPRGNTNVFVQYDQYGRATNEVDGLSRATRTEYGVPSTWQIRHTDPALNQWVETYDTKGHLLTQQDPLFNTTTYTYDTNGNRTSMTEPLGWTTYFGYDTNANVIAKTNALGEVTRWVFNNVFNKPVQQITPQPPDTNGWTTWTNFYAYDSAGNLTNQSDGIGTLVSYTYLTNGLVFTSKDANSNITQFGYDGNGFLKARTDPATNTTSYTLNDVGWKMHLVDALGNPTTYAYDLNGNATQVEDPLARTFYKTFDGDGNLLSATDGKGQLTSYGYDAANQRTNMVDRTGTNVWFYYYTSRGKLDHVTDPLVHSVTNFYDAANRLVRMSDPLGNFVTNRYDANGNLLYFFDKLGQRWSKTYDRLNRIQTESDPLGNVKRTIYDIADRVQQIITPNAFPSVHIYDGRGRLTKWVDPQNFPWHYDYDGVGNITNITDSLQGHYVMIYSNRNERILEHNQDGFEWHYQYDELLRLKTQTDPNQTVRTATYDAGGRNLFVDFSTGRRDSFTYDDNDNMKTVGRRVSGVTTSLQFIYDALDRVKQQDDANSKTVLYGYDPLGRVTFITYPGGKTLTNSYDPLGRLTNQVDWAGRQMNYTYDLADRLVTRSYPNGVLQTNKFDTSGRVTSMAFFTPNPPSSTNSPIQMALSYAYDRNGNKTGEGESGTFSWPLPSLNDETANFSPSGRLQNRMIQNNSATSNQVSSITYRYDSSGNMTNANGHGETWALTYDEDNRTTSIDWDAGISSKHIINRYDALGRRFSKSIDGVMSGYVLSLAGGMERVLCDLDANGNITAWYVHGADLCYRVDATNGLTCYHADAIGNVLALTDGQTNLVAKYAYTPYGLSLCSTNSANQDSNPYLFVGSQGVMEELPGLYFMRARYYAADADAFLSTDSMKKIGPGWKPSMYDYASGNPLNNFDPTGLFSLYFGAGIDGNIGAVVGLEGSGSHGIVVNLNSLFAGNMGEAFGTYNTIQGGVSAGEGAGVSAHAEACFDTGSTQVSGSSGGYIYSSLSAKAVAGASVTSFRTSDGAGACVSASGGLEEKLTASAGGGYTYTRSLNEDPGAFYSTLGCALFGSFHRQSVL
ncbi:MAG TPA: LamG-like jellyroll fold domain-containing protein [Candidatus Angelobacter sp.]|nr:LamG-like jellyroll fold domain-containing protein [Candidatus Angelobacter sp.]